MVVEARGDAAETARHLARVLASGEWPGVQARAVGSTGHEIDVPPALDVGHEAHFAELLDELLGWIDTGRRAAALSARTLAKYTLLAEAAAVTARDEAAAASRRRQCMRHPHPDPLPRRGEGVASIPSPPEGERDRVRGRTDL